MRDKLSLPEALLRLAMNDMDQYKLSSQEDEFVQLNSRAKGTFYLTLSHLPSQSHIRVSIILTFLVNFKAIYVYISLNIAQLISE